MTDTTTTATTARTVRRVATGGVAALAGLAMLLPTTAVAAPEDRGSDSIPETAAAAQPDETALREQVLEGARDAQREVHVKGTPPGRATPATDALDAGMAKVVADGAIGVSVRVDSPDLTWRGSAGDRALGKNPPAGWQDRFRVASNTKMMVSTLVLQQVEAGTWTLDTRVEDVLPGLFPEHPDVTVRQLLSHTSGMPNGTQELLLLHMSDPTSLDSLLEAISRDYTGQDHVDAVNAFPWTAPGEFVYSNAGYVTLGMMLEAQTGRSVESLLRSDVWRPAGMRHTSYPLDPGMPNPALEEDAWVGDGWLELGGFDPDLFRSSGAVVSTTADLNAFTEALVSGELVDPALVEEMLTPVTSELMDYGLGVYRLPDPCSTPDDPQWLYGHDGASYGTLSVAFTSADGSRQVSLGVTGRDVSSVPGRWNINDVLVPALLATC